MLVGYGDSEYSFWFLGELVADVDVDSLQTSELRVDSKQDHVEEKYENPKIGHRQQKQSFRKNVKTEFQAS